MEKISGVVGILMSGVVMLLSQGAEAAEFGTSPLGVRAARFTQMEVDARLQEELEVEGAAVLVDGVSNTVHLTLERGYVCRAEVCAQVMPAPVVLSLPILSRQKDDCGRIVTRAGRGGVSRSLGQPEIVLIESEGSVCGDQNATAPTELFLETHFSGGEAAKSRSRFEGPALEGIPAALPIFQP
jgi:hypothetical protein